MNNKWELFQKFLITQEEQIQVVDFIINSVIVFVLAWLLELTYRKCGRSLSNRKAFSANFILIGFATMLIISVVKSSLALSLGLVGALSIIRFRAAIKEPEELAYLFLVISLL
jgi:chromate transport protein ChrA